MAAITDKEDPCEDYWKDFDVKEFESKGEKVKVTTSELLDGISIKDLCDGKEIMFEVGNSFPEEDADLEDDIPAEVTYSNMRSLRENRGAPPLTCSFSEIARRMTNLTGDGTVKKQVVSNGFGKVVPDQAYVTVHYNLYKESCELPFDSTYLRNRPEKFKLGQGETLLGLDCAIKSMKKNENSMFFIKWQMAFGAMGCPDRIEKKCDIIADITLMNFMEINAGDALSCISEKDIGKEEFSRFINQTKKLLCNGSDEFLKGEIRTAITSYKKGLRILNGIRLANEEQESIMLGHKVKCLVNLAICYNRLGRHEQACVMCQEALSIDNNSVKANFHYGKANLALSNFSMARKYLIKANRLKPNDKDINQEIKKLSDKKALYEMRNRSFWEKAFSARNEEEPEVKKSSLDEFEKQLVAGLQESLKEKKPYSLPLQNLTDKEIEICKRVATEFAMDFEPQSKFYLFKEKTTSVAP